MHFYNMGLICESRFLLSDECSRGENSEKRKSGAWQCQEGIPHERALFYFEAYWMDFLSHTLGYKPYRYAHFPRPFFATVL